MCSWKKKGPEKSVSRTNTHKFQWMLYCIERVQGNSQSGKFKSVKWLAPKSCPAHPLLFKTTKSVYRIQGVKINLSHMLLSQTLQLQHDPEKCSSMVKKPNPNLSLKKRLFPNIGMYLPLLTDPKGHHRGLQSCLVWSSRRPRPPEHTQNKFRISD